jgi:arabinogalactan endo-1,4-beta-galactosidase/putative cell wall-binding protein
MFKKGFKRVLSMVLCTSLSLGVCSNFTTIMKVKASEVPSTFAKGADVGWLPQMEASGYKFYDDKGNPTADCLEILKAHGINSIRLRAWVNPSTDPQSGHCSTSETVDLAKRAQNLGFRIMIDLHYSDSWADPGKQVKPAAWANDTFDELKIHVYDYTKGVMDALKTAGVTPDWVQVGNEINPGMLLAGLNDLHQDASGSIGDYGKLAELINKGYDAVKAVSSTTKVVIHLANGYDNTTFSKFFKGITDNSAEFDVIGMSYYPTYSANMDYTSSIDSLGNNLEAMASTYHKEVMVVEVGQAATTGDNAYNMLLAVQNKLKEVSNNRGTGVFYWEPEGAESWSHYGMSAWGSDGKPTKALDAFIDGAQEIDVAPVQSIAIKPQTRIEVGSSEILNTTFTPSNSTYRGVTFSSSNTDKATVDPYSGSVTGVAVGSSTITATSYDGHKTAQCVVTVIPNSNFVLNAGFESDLDNWTVVDTKGATSIVTDNKHSGAKALHYWFNSPFNFDVSQAITNLDNGTYTLTAYTRGQSGKAGIKIYATPGQGVESNTDANNLGWETWAETKVSNIEVTNGQITIGVSVNQNGDNDSWGDIDDFILSKDSDASKIAAAITSLVAPGKDVTSLTLPTVPEGYTIAIKSTSQSGVIDASGTIIPPVADTTVTLAFTIISTSDSSTADTGSINVIVPAKSTNLVQNSGFETNDLSNWTITGDISATGIGNWTGDGSKYKFKSWLGSAFKYNISQGITSIPNGNYTMKAWVEGGDGGTVNLFAKGFGGTDKTLDVTGHSSWTQVTMNNIKVTNGQCTIGMDVNGAAKSWWELDGIEFYKVSDLAPTVVAITPTPVVVPTEIKTDSNSNVVATLDSSKIDKNNVNVIKIDELKPESKVQVQMPASAIGIGTGSFEINSKAASLSIPTSIIEQSLLSSGGTLQVSQNLMAATDANALLVKAPVGAKVNGKVFTFGMAVYDSNNRVVSDIHNFASGKSVAVTINLSNEDIKGMDTTKLSAFYFDIATKKWVEIAGSFDAAKMTYTFNTTHFTDFTIMQKSQVNVNRLSGDNRIETSIEIAKQQYTTAKPDAVVLATANDFADALAGSGLAYKYNAPMLLVNKTVSDSEKVLDYITTNLSKDKNIYILGEAGVVSKEIEEYLSAQGYKIVRLGGKDRYETNQKIEDYLNAAKGTSLVIATGDGFADALSISSIASIKSFSLLLNGKDSLSASVSDYITNIRPTTVYVVGGEGVLSANIEAQIKKLNGNIQVVRLGGKDRYETSMKILDYFNLSSTTITVATGIDFPDALSGSVLAARKNSGVLLIDNKDVSKQKESLSKEKITEVIVFGGEGAVRNDIITSLLQK